LRVFIIRYNVDQTDELLPRKNATTPWSAAWYGQHLVAVKDVNKDGLDDIITCEDWKCNGGGSGGYGFDSKITCSDPNWNNGLEGKTTVYYYNANRTWTRTQQIGKCFDTCNRAPNSNSQYATDTPNTARKDGRGNGFCGSWLDADRDGILDFIAGAAQEGEFAIPDESGGTRVGDQGPILILGKNGKGLRLQGVALQERQTWVGGADVNGDGADDIVIGRETGEVIVMLNKNSVHASMAEPAEFPSTGFAYKIVGFERQDQGITFPGIIFAPTPGLFFPDFDRDNLTDLVVTSGATGGARMFKNEGTNAMPNYLELVGEPNYLQMGNPSKFGGTSGVAEPARQCGSDNKQNSQACGVLSVWIMNLGHENGPVILADVKAPTRYQAWLPGTVSRNIIGDDIGGYWLRGIKAKSWYGHSSSGPFGFQGAIADMNGDGLSDFIISNPTCCDVLFNEGTSTNPSFPADPVKNYGGFPDSNSTQKRAWFP